MTTLPSLTHSPPHRTPPSPPAPTSASVRTSSKHGRICDPPICHTVTPVYACAHVYPVRRYCEAALKFSDPPMLCSANAQQKVLLPNRKCPLCAAKARVQRWKERDAARAEKERREEEQRAERMRRAVQGKGKRD